MSTQPKPPSADNSGSESEPEVAARKERQPISFDELKALKAKGRTFRLTAIELNGSHYSFPPAKLPTKK